MFAPRGARACRGRAGPGPPGAGRAAGPDRTDGEHEEPITPTQRLSWAARGHDHRQRTSLKEKRRSPPSGCAPTACQAHEALQGAPEARALSIWSWLRQRCLAGGGISSSPGPPRCGFPGAAKRTPHRSAAPRAGAAQRCSGCSRLWVLSGRSCSVCRWHSPG